VIGGECDATNAGGIERDTLIVASIEQQRHPSDSSWPSSSARFQLVPGRADDADPVAEWS
jgi:hypothetical protein